MNFNPQKKNMCNCRECSSRPIWLIASLTCNFFTCSRKKSAVVAWIFTEKCFFLKKQFLVNIGIFLAAWSRGHRPKSPGSRSRAKSGRNPHLHHHHHRPVSFLLASLSRIVALVHQHPANMAAMATAPCFPATPGLPARGAVAARSRMAAGGSRSQRRRSSSGVFLCRSSTTGSSRMEDYNTAMKRMMRNPYEYHHDLGPYQSFFSSSTRFWSYLDNDSIFGMGIVNFVPPKWLIWSVHALSCYSITALVRLYQLMFDCPIHEPEIL